MTSQEAPLEKLLNKIRTRKIKQFIKNKRVLDFGCGRNAWTAQSLKKECHEIVGVDHSLDEDFSKIKNICLYKNLSLLGRKKFDVITMLAVIEHIKPLEFRNLLNEFIDYTKPESQIVATIPTTKSRPILEFLSYRLNLIDQSQIQDHKVYYDDLWINEIVDKTPWRVSFYKTFQMGLNSLVVFSRL